MTDGYTSSGHEHDFTERVLRDGSIANAHAKFIEARSRDILDRNFNFNATYRYVTSKHKIIDEKQYRFDSIALRPMNGDINPPAGIIRVNVQAYVKPFNEATEREQNMYILNTMAQQIPGEEVISSDGSVTLIPSNTVIIKTYGSDGRRARLLLGSEEMMPLESDEQLFYTGGSNNTAQEFRASPTLDTSAKLAEIHEWFDLSTLQTILATYEPFNPSNGASTDSAA